jgi:nitrate/nitrite-specific signal transduction histidine kinase
MLCWADDQTSTPKPARVQGDALSCATAPPDVDRKPVHRVELHVSDDGRGFDPPFVRRGHYGLSIVRERAGVIGADLTVESQPDQGTEIVVMWEERQ